MEVTMGLLLELLPGNVFIAAMVSILLSIIIAVAGLIPSTFITAANIIFFGFQTGLVISIIGEAAGAIISFLLYRIGFKAIEKRVSKPINNRFLERLKSAKGMEAIILVLILRILPFVPSGLVTLAASISKMNIIHFAFASTLGKIPALFIEAYSVFQFLTWKFQYQIGATIFALAVLTIYIIWSRRKDNESL
ncbi:MAG TPA: VTT domain-containing protein [Bacillales bacterium]|nr:VTT domain-containing protein [Bacillales bacterium]